MYRHRLVALALTISPLWGCAPATAPPPTSSAAAVAATPASSAPPSFVAVQEAALLEPECVRRSATSLSRDGNWALVAGRGQVHRAGSALVFTRQGGAWVEQALLTAGNPRTPTWP